MNTEPRPRHWLMPWLAPFVFSVVYIEELWREGAFVDPAGAVIQLILGVPLVVSASVFLAVIEQEVRSRLLTAGLQRWLLWTPRALLLLLVVLLALRSLDVFAEGEAPVRSRLAW